MIKLGLCVNLKLGNLDALRDWCHANDAVHALCLIMQQESPDDYIIGSGKTHSVRELVDCAFKCVGLNYQDCVLVDPNFYRLDESVQLVRSINKIQAKTGWHPQYSFDDLVKIMVEHYLRELAEEMEA